MKENAVTLDINQVEKVLSGVEQLLRVGVFVFIGHCVVYHHVDSLVAVELCDFIHIDSSLLDIESVHDIQDCSDSVGLKFLDIHFIKRVRSHKNSAIADLLVEEMVKEVTIGFVHPSIDDVNLV